VPREDAGMPTIRRFFGIVIAMYFDDHEPPHFPRARRRRQRERAPLEVLESTLERRQLRLVLARSELHQDELRENWHRAPRGET
jgi:hypothetical protein